MHRRSSLKCALAAATLLAITASGQSAEKVAIKWQSDPGKAHKLARQHKRPMLLLITREACFYCTKMKHSTYRDPFVASDITNHFVAAQIDAKGYTELVQRLGVEVYPTTVIISPDYRVVDVIRGYVDARRLRQKMAQATRQVRVAKSDVGARQNVSRR